MGLAQQPRAALAELTSEAVVRHEERFHRDNKGVEHPFRFRRRFRAPGRRAAALVGDPLQIIQGDGLRARPPGEQQLRIEGAKPRAHAGGRFVRADRRKSGDQVERAMVDRVDTVTAQAVSQRLGEQLVSARRIPVEQVPAGLGRGPPGRIRRGRG